MEAENEMTKSVFTCHPDDPLSTAARLMWDNDIGAVPVLGEEERLVGIVTDRDICMCAYFTGEPLSAIPVAHAMARVVFTVEPGEAVEPAEELMRTKQVRRLPVVEGGKLVGMVTLGDLARAYGARKQITSKEISETLAAVVEPRPVPAAAAA